MADRQTPASGLSLQDVRIFQGNREMLSVTHQIGPGEVLTVMGPSGAGKSTLLSFITGSLPADFRASGRVILDGRDITDLAPEKRNVGILFQDDLLFPHLSVGQNLGFGLNASIRGRGARKSAIEAALEEIGLQGFADRDPATLSGGQKSRVSLMRMLLSDPCALLLDEAFARLDPERRARTRDMVFALARKRQLATLMVTHDREDADAADGDIVYIGPHEA